MKAGAVASRAAVPKLPRPAATSQPAAKSAPPAVTRTAPAAERPSGPPAIKRGAAECAEQSVPDDDDPFADDRAAAVKAIPVSPRPAPGKSLEVKCPMCETTGYVSPKAAGQPVKCCNADCLVPVFAAPAPPKKVEPPPPPPKKSIPPLAYGITGVVALGILVIAVLKMLPAPPTELPPAAVTTVRQKGSGETSPEELASLEKAKTDKEKATKGKKDNPKESLIETALSKLVDAAFAAQDFRKAHARHMAASAFIAAGDLEKGADQLESLQKVGKQTPYEGCLPTVQLAWKQLPASPDAAAKSANEAVRLFETYNKRSRGGVDGAIAVAAILSALGNQAEGRAALEKQQRTPDLNQLAAALQVVWNDGTFDLDRPLTGRSVGNWLAPRETAVVLILAAHGRWSEAQAWAAAAPNPAARAETTLVWAEAFAHAKPAAVSGADAPNPAAAADGQSLAVQARLWARLANVLIGAGDRAAAEKLLAQASEAIQGAAPSEPIKVESRRQLKETRLPPDSTAMRLAALAAADIGIAQAQLGQKEPAWASFRLALQHLRGMAPSVPSIQARLAETENDGNEEFRNEIRVLYQAKNNAEGIRQAIVRYKSACNELLNGAVQRFNSECDVLEAALRHGLLDQVWTEMQVVAQKPELSDQVPYVASGLGLRVAMQFAAAGDAEMHKQIQSAAQAGVLKMPEDVKRRAKIPAIEQAIAEGDITRATNQLDGSQADGGTLHELALRMACRLVHAGKLGDAYRLISGLRDPVIREDGSQLVSALAARLGQQNEVWEQATAKPNANDFSSMASSMVLGIVTQKPAP